MFMKIDKNTMARHVLCTMNKKGKVTNSATYYIDLPSGKMFDGKGKEVKEMKLECLSTKKGQ